MGCKQILQQIQHPVGGESTPQLSAMESPPTFPAWEIPFIASTMDMVGGESFPRPIITADQFPGKIRNHNRLLPL